MGCYQEGVMKDSVAGKDVTAHIFECASTNTTSQYTILIKLSNRYTSNVIVTDTGEISMGACPVQILFCLKEQNKKKLNSHRWFFNAFGPLLKPNGECQPVQNYTAVILIFLQVCVLLDVGTKPTGTSIYELWKCGWDASNLFSRTHIFLVGFDKHSNVGGACGECVPFMACMKYLADICSRI
jgi:chitin synthase